VTLAQVVLDGRSRALPPVDAVVVMGAAQYDGRPSAQLAARLDHVVTLWEMGGVGRLVVTGGSRPGDRFSEAAASEEYLVAIEVCPVVDRLGGSGDDDLGVDAGGEGAARRRRVDDHRHRSPPRFAEPPDRRGGRVHRCDGLDDSDVGGLGVDRGASACRRVAGVALGRLVGFERLSGRG
jgi:hypothetical protein